MKGEPSLKWRRESILDVYALAGGLFLILSPWLFSFVYQWGTLNSLLIGSLVLVFSAFALLNVATRVEQWLLFALGLWLIVAPWILGFLHSSSMHVSIAVGGIIVYLSLLKILLRHDPKILD